MTMMIQATAYMGTKSVQREDQGVNCTVYNFTHLGLAGEKIRIKGIVPTDSALNARLEDIRSAAEKGKEQKQFVRVLVRGTNATLAVKSEYSQTGKANRKTQQFDPGVIQKANGLDFNITNIRIIDPNTAKEPEEFTATVLGHIEPDGFRDAPKTLKYVDLLMKPHQEDQADGFHLRVTADKGTLAHQVLNHRNCVGGLYWVSGNILRKSMDEADKDKLIAPWDRIELNADSVYLVSGQDMRAQKDINNSVETRNHQVRSGGGSGDILNLFNNDEQASGLPVFTDLDIDGEDED